MKVFASDFAREENGENDWQREDLEGNQERKNQRKDRPGSKGKEEKIRKKETEGCDGSRRPRVRVQSAPQSRKFAPTVPEPFGMTV